jgi:hypothetical protein
MKKLINTTKKLKEMKKLINATKKLKEMKKLIYVIVLLTGIHLAQAQEIVNSFFVYSPTMLVPLNHVSLDLPPNVTDNTVLDLPLAIIVKNTGTQDLDRNDSLYFKTKFNEATPLGSIALLSAMMRINDSIQFTFRFPVRAKDIKSGEYANKICMEITGVFHNGVRTSISQTPHCADITINGAGTGGTGLTDANAFKDVILYPNPVRDNNLKIENLNEATDIHLYNLTGQLIQKESAVMGNTMIDVSNLSNGLYILKMQSGKSIRTEKIQIIR